MYYERMLFPLRDITGVHIVDQGRAMFDFKARAVPKYWHSTYDKSHYLHGLYELVELILEKGYVLLGEGPFDTMAAWEQNEPLISGFGNPINPYTALLVNLFVDTVYLANDPDEAGEEKTKTAIKELKIFGTKIYKLKLKYDISDLHADDIDLHELINKAKKL
jgi:DNA primase